MSSEPKNSAEQRFRESFERLKSGCPLVLSSPASVTQNNVAREAGCDPSALRKDRYPSLIREIQAFVEIQANHLSSKRSLITKKRNKLLRLQNHINALTAERDHAHSQLISAKETIIELTQEILNLKMRK